MYILGFIFIIFLSILIYIFYDNLLKNIKLNILNKKRVRIIINILLTFITIRIKSIISIYLLHFIVIYLFINLITKLIAKNKINYIKIILSLVISLIIIIYGLINVNNIKETRYNLTSNKQIDNYKIGLISDAHYGLVLSKDILKDIVNKLNKEKLDILILAGDIVDESTTYDEMLEVFNILSKVKTKEGIYYVYGNHDRKVYSENRNFSERQLSNTITNNKINILQDKSYELEKVILIGREDYSKNRKKLKEIIPKNYQNKYLITIDHQPREYQENINNNIDLILSGHTHSGQLKPIKLFIDLFKIGDLSYGYKQISELDAIVSSGLSVWGFPIRTEGHSEYVIININK